MSKKKAKTKRNRFIFSEDGKKILVPGFGFVECDINDQKDFTPKEKVYIREDSFIPDPADVIQVQWAPKYKFCEQVGVISSTSTDIYPIPDLNDLVTKNDRKKAINDIVDAVFSSPSQTILVIHVPDEKATDSYHKLLSRLKEKNAIYQKFIIVYEPEKDKSTLFVSYDVQQTY